MKELKLFETCKLETGNFYTILYSTNIVYYTFLNNL